MVRATLHLKKAGLQNPVLSNILEHASAKRPHVVPHKRLIGVGKQAQLCKAPGQQTPESRCGRNRMKEGEERECGEPGLQGSLLLPGEISASRVEGEKSAEASVSRTKYSRYFGAVLMMRAGPSESAFRRRFQTTLCCFA